MTVGTLFIVQSVYSENRDTPLNFLHNCVRAVPWCRTYISDTLAIVVSKVLISMIIKTVE